MATKDDAPLFHTSYRNRALKKVPDYLPPPVGAIVGLIAGITSFIASAAIVAVGVAGIVNLSPLGLGLVTTTMIGLGVTTAISIGIIVGGSLLALGSLGLVGTCIYSLVRHNQKQQQITKQIQSYINEHPGGKEAYNQELLFQREANTFIQAVEDDAAKHLYTSLAPHAGRYDTISGNNFSHPKAVRFTGKEDAIRKVIDDIMVRTLTNGKGAHAPIDKARFQELKEIGPHTLSERICNVLGNSLQFVSILISSIANSISPTKTTAYRREFAGRASDIVGDKEQKPKQSGFFRERLLKEREQPNVRSPA